MTVLGFRTTGVGFCDTRGGTTGNTRVRGGDVEGSAGLVNARGGSGGGTRGAADTVCEGVIKNAGARPNWGSGDGVWSGVSGDPGGRRNGPPRGMGLDGSESLRDRFGSGPVASLIRGDTRYAGVIRWKNAVGAKSKPRREESMEKMEKMLVKGIWSDRWRGRNALVSPQWARPGAIRVAVKRRSHPRRSSEGRLSTQTVPQRAYTATSGGLRRHHIGWKGGAPDVYSGHLCHRVMVMVLISVAEVRETLNGIPSSRQGREGAIGSEEWRGGGGRRKRRIVCATNSGRADKPAQPNPDFGVNRGNFQLVGPLFKQGDADLGYSHWRQGPWDWVHGIRPTLAMALATALHVSKRCKNICNEAGWSGPSGCYEGRHSAYPLLTPPPHEFATSFS
ncbi:hypothetical protein DFH09DRAFT_1085983 [Mycena vulgaris]|nr:hypothetical protein DFH09DRAFT_1085983 [Mycena vulgaris]